MAARNASFTPHRMLQGAYVAFVAGGIGLNLLLGQGLFASILLGAWVGIVAAGLCLVGFVGYVCLAVLDAA